jgi:hypothetical protein
LRAGIALAGVLPRREKNPRNLLHTAGHLLRRHRRRPYYLTKLGKLAAQPVAVGDVQPLKFFELG